MTQRQLAAFCRRHGIHPRSLRLLYEWSRTRDGMRFVLGASLGVMPNGKRNARRRRVREVTRMTLDWVEGA